MGYPVNNSAEMFAFLRWLKESKKLEREQNTREGWLFERYGYYADQEESDEQDD